MSDPFSTASSSFDNIQEYKGELVLITPTEYMPNLKTKHGDAAAVDGDMVVLTGDEPGKEVDGMRFFHAAIVQALKKRIGTPKPMLLGRVGTYPNPHKKGEDAWQLEDPSEADIELARKYLAKVAREKAERKGTPSANDPFA